MELIYERIHRCSLYIQNELIVCIQSFIKPLMNRPLEVRGGGFLIGIVCSGLFAKGVYKASGDCEKGR